MLAISDCQPKRKAASMNWRRPPGAPGTSAKRSSSTWTTLKLEEAMKRHGL
jgi:hypothetical protein